MFNWIISAIGALAWTSPFVYKWLTKPKLKAKLISKFENTGTFNNKAGILHFIALNVISLNKPFHIQNVDIEIWYKDSDKSYEGSIFWARKNKWVSQNKEKIRLNISPESSLPFVAYLPENITKTIYITFYVDKASLSEFSEIKFKFKGYKGKAQEILINSQDINPDQILWDDRIWKTIPKRKSLASRD